MPLDLEQGFGEPQPVSGIPHAYGGRMKTNPSVASARWLSRHDRRDRRDASFPRVVSEFQPSRFDDNFGGSGLPWRRPGCSGPTWKVLMADASRSFRLEAAVLGLVTLVCVWPIAIMIGEVIRLLK